MSRDLSSSGKPDPEKALRIQQGIKKGNFNRAGVNALNSSKSNGR